MRWGSSRVEFVRPVHWAVLVFGKETIPASILGTESGNLTKGHRFHAPETIEVDPSSYESQLESQCWVIPSLEKRKAKIKSLVIKQAELNKASVIIDENLLSEVAALVEWPVALTGHFNEDYLRVPKEALVSSMKEHQKCFYLENSQGEILPNFITVSNLESNDKNQVIKGNEKVIGPRLADAAFFFDQDKKSPLSSRTETLKTVIFQEKLGTLFDKSERVSRLARYIAEKLHYNPDHAERASKLAKCDLLTYMVGEFADLQGVMGYYYAKHDGEPDNIALALNEQYLPRFSGDSLPVSETGTALALAERLDTIIGLFGIGQPPSGSKDPFALRRSALGILRILVEKKLDLDLDECITFAIPYFKNLTETESLEAKVLDFIFDRFKSWYKEKGISAQVFQSVAETKSPNPYDFDKRVAAVNEFTKLSEAGALSAANKRVSNILAKLDNLPTQNVEESLLSENAETDLFNKLHSVIITVAPLIEQRNYTSALQSMAELQQPVDTFFDHVMVNTDDNAVRENRLALLQQLRQLFLQIADISCLQT